MTHEAFRGTGPKPVNLRGFLSVLSEQMLSPPRLGAERFGDRSYAVISDKYLNFSSRVGYHYSIVDSYCGQTQNKNYITFSFMGGAADEVRRNRRVRAIGRILETLDFQVDVVGDRMTARYQKYPCDKVRERLDRVGRLLQYTRQMDMFMNSEESVEEAARRFLEERYGLDE
jgi:pyruvate,water dikinase